MPSFMTRTVQRQCARRELVVVPFRLTSMKWFLLLLAALAVWRIGERRYCSTGS